MFLKNENWVYPNSLPKNICFNIIKYCLNKKNIKKGTVRNGSFQKIRNSFVVWNDERWLKNTIMHYIMDANKKAGWNFQFTQYEKAQFTIYDNSQFYNWHTDASANTKDDGSHRKLSVTLSLNDEDEFEGGCFEIDNRNNYHEKNIHQLNNIRSAGSLVVFPSFLYHRVTPVTKGTRYSLVMWYSGRPYI